MNMQELNEQMKRRMEEARQYAESDDLKEKVGIKAVAFFKDSFVNEGFTDETLEKWDDVKRRDPSSPWYGHNGFTKKGEETSKSQQRLNKKHSGTVGNFSQERATAKILTGGTRQLRESITYNTTSTGAKITSDKPYSAVHQFGGKAYIYGKHEFTMKARPYMGKSKKLIGELRMMIKDDFERILKGK